MDSESKNKFPKQKSQKNRLGKQDLAPTSNIALQIGLGEKIKLGLKPHFRKSQNLQHTHYKIYSKFNIWSDPRAASPLYSKLSIPKEKTCN